MTTQLLGADHADMLKLIEAGGNARRAEKRAQREKELARPVRRIRQLYVADGKRGIDIDGPFNNDAARAVTAWVRENELILPIADPDAVASHILHLLIADASMAEMHRRARAIVRIWENGGWELDQEPLRIMLEYAQDVRRLADGGDDGGGQPIVNSPSPPLPDAEAVPLAASAS